MARRSPTIRTRRCKKRSSEMLSGLAGKKTERPDRDRDRAGGLGLCLCLCLCLFCASEVVLHFEDRSVSSLARARTVSGASAEQAGGELDLEVFPLVEAEHHVPLLPDRLPFSQRIRIELGVAQKGGWVHLAIEVVEKLNRAGPPEPKPQSRRPDVQVRELGAQHLAIVAEAVHPIKARFVVLDAGLAEGSIGAALRGAIAGAERVAQR